MGMEYKLIKVKTKEIYDLDKGNWVSVFPTRQLFKMYNTTYPWEYGDNVQFKDDFSDIGVSIEQLGEIYKDKTYLYKIVNDILSWCGNDYIIMDHDCGELYEEWCVSPSYAEYKITGNRFMKDIYLSQGIQRYLK